MYIRLMRAAEISVDQTTVVAVVILAVNLQLDGVAATFNNKYNTYAHYFGEQEKYVDQKYYQGHDLPHWLVQAHLYTN